MLLVVQLSNSNSNFQRQAFNYYYYHYLHVGDLVCLVLDGIHTLFVVVRWLNLAGYCYALEGLLEDFCFVDDNVGDLGGRWSVKP